jgi:hypothetical protein
MPNVTSASAPNNKPFVILRLLSGASCPREAYSSALSPSAAPNYPNLQLNLAHFGTPRRLPKVTVSAELRRELDESAGFLRAALFPPRNGEIDAASPDAEAGIFRRD